MCARDLPLRPVVPFCEQPLHERAAAQDALVRPDPFSVLADGAHLGPAAQRADEPAPHQVEAAALGNAIAQIGAVRPAGGALALSEPGQDMGPILPGRGVPPEEAGVATPGIAVEMREVGYQFARRGFRWM